MTLRNRMEFRVRLILHDNTVRVGGYMGTGEHHIHVIDEITGEIHSVPKDHVHTCEGVKY